MRMLEYVRDLNLFDISPKCQFASVLEHVQRAPAANTAILTVRLSSFAVGRIADDPGQRRGCGSLHAYSVTIFLCFYSCLQIDFIL